MDNLSGVSKAVAKGGPFLDSDVEPPHVGSF